MAIARKCDRCGTYHDGRISKLTVHSPCGFDIIECERDLCQECMDEFNEFMIGVKPICLLDRIKSIKSRKD